MKRPGSMLVILGLLGMLALLALAGCEPSATPVRTATVLPSPTPAVTSPAPPAAGDSRFGACFFSGKLNAANLPCAELQKMGIRTTFFGAWWGQIEPQPGKYDWSAIDPAVDAALACGVEPVIKISASPGPGQDSTPPDDVDAYARFVAALVQHLKGRVRTYAIENEINNPRLVWTADTYGPLLAAAYQAIKRADPQAQVLDSGLTMQAYIPARANELVQAGEVEDAIAMLQRFQAGMTRTPKNLPATPQKLAEWLDEPIYVRAVGLMDELRQHPDTYDAVQLHYLQDAWELIPEYVSWVRTWFPGKPFEFWEIGFGWSGEEAGQQFTEEGHAAGVIKTLVSALGEGASRVIYEPYSEGLKPEDQSDRAQRKFGRGLVTLDGPRLAATAYGTMASQLSGYQSTERLDLGTGIWAYHFTTPRGDVYVVWAKQEATVRLPVSVARVTMADLTGAVTQVDPTALPVGDSPVFVTIPQAAR